MPTDTSKSELDLEASKHFEDVLEYKSLLPGWFD